MPSRKRRYPKCPGCGNRVLRGGDDREGMCSHCWRATVNGSGVELAQSVEATTTPPIAAERIIEQWGRA